jgi:predicted nucleotidyltransferase
MTKQPIELMFGAYRRQLLAHLLLRPDERFHVRELARMTSIPAGSIHRELKAMAEAGLLLREQSGNQVYYRANPRCPIFDELAAIFRKTVGLAGLLRNALASLADKIEFAFVFGSMARGQQTVFSDIDVIILGKLSLAQAVNALSPVAETLGRDINPVVMTPDRFADLLDKQDRFAVRLVNEPRLLIVGDEDEFTKLIAD